MLVISITFLNFYTSWKRIGKIDNEIQLFDFVCGLWWDDNDDKVIVQDSEDNLQPAVYK